MLFFLSSLILIVSCFFASANLKIKNKVVFLLSLYLSGYSFNIIVAQLLSTINNLSNSYLYLGLQFLILTILVAIWIIQKQPNLFGPFCINNFKGQITKLLNSIKRNPLTSIFTIFVIFGYVVLAYLIIRVPPNNSDSLQTHLSRIVYWLQQNSLKPVNTFSIFSSIYPYNANLNILWTMLFSKTDKFVGFVQYFSLITCAIAVFGLSRILGGQRRSALIVSLLWATLPINVLEATTTQNDLAVSALFTSSIYLLFEYFTSKKQSSLFLSGLSLGLSLGTKTTVLFTAVGLMVLIIFSILKNRKNIIVLLRWAIISSVCFILLGSYVFVMNTINYKNPLGLKQGTTIEYSIGGYSIGEKLLYNIPRFIYQYFSFDSLPVSIAQSGIELKNEIFSNFTDSLHFSLEAPNAIKISSEEENFSYSTPASYNEDTSWFGPVSFIVITPSFLYCLYLGIKKKDSFLLILIAISLSFLFMEVSFRPGWDAYQGRYFILSTTIIFPISVHIFNKSLVSKLFTCLLYVLSILVFFFAVFSNESKPLLKYETFKNLYLEMGNSYIPTNAVESWYKKISMGFYKTLWENLPSTKTIYDYNETTLRTINNQSKYKDILIYVEENIPENTTMGLVFDKGLTFDYIFFGKNFTRHLIPVNPNSLMYNKLWLDENNINYLLVSNNTLIKIPNYLKLETTIDSWAIYEVEH